MVRLLTAGDGFEAKLVVARLGAEGVLWELRGGVDGPYPMGPVHVYVDEADLEVAREVMAAVEEVPAEPDAGHERSPMVLWLVLVGLFADGRAEPGQGVRLASGGRGSAQRRGRRRRDRTLARRIAPRRNPRCLVNPRRRRRVAATDQARRIALSAIPGA